MTHEWDHLVQAAEEGEPVGEAETEGPGADEAGPPSTEEEPPDKVDSVIVYLDDAGEWRWAAIAGSDTVANSGEGYKRKSWAVKQALKVTGVQPQVKPDYRRQT